MQIKQGGIKKIQFKNGDEVVIVLTNEKLGRFVLVETTKRVIGHSDPLTVHTLEKENVVSVSSVRMHPEERKKIIEVSMLIEKKVQNNLAGIHFPLGEWRNAYGLLAKGVRLYPDNLFLLHSIRILSYSINFLLFFVKKYKKSAITVLF